MPRDRRAYDLWAGFNTFPKFLRGYYRAAKGKYDRDSVMAFHSNLEMNIFQIQEDLEKGVYRWGRYKAFWVMEPKLRMIESAPFRDRVTHQAMAEVMEPLFDPSFFHHSYACRSGRGTHRAMGVVKNWIELHPDFTYLQMDVAKYFPSINREILFEMIEKRIGDVRFLALIRSLLDSSPSPIGIPIGNLTSQIFANLYLDAVDQYVKRVLRVKHYIRYMDDIVLFHKDRSQLEAWRNEIEFFGKQKLGLRFHPHKVSIEKVRMGVTFLGYRIFPNMIRIKSQSLRRFRKRLRKPAPLNKKVQTLLSYEAHILHTNGHANLMPNLRKIAFSKEAFTAM